MNLGASLVHASPVSQPDVPQVSAPLLDISHHDDHQQTRQVRALETVKRHAESVRGNPKKPKTQRFATHEARVKSLERGRKEAGKRQVRGENLKKQKGPAGLRHQKHLSQGVANIRRRGIQGQSVVPLHMSHNKSCCISRKLR